MNKILSSKILVAASLIALTINTSCKNEASKTTPASSNMAAASGKIAYVNVDSLQEKYAYWKTESTAPVSYTHLDVYKRQVYTK